MWFCTVTVYADAGVASGMSLPSTVLTQDSDMRDKARGLISKRSWKDVLQRIVLQS